MNKRSAMLTAAGLVLTLLVAGIAMAMGVTGPTADAKTTSRAKPIVTTVSRTVTVHQNAQGSGSGTVRSDESASGGSSLEDSDDSYESDGSDDDSYESDEHESDEHESEGPEEHETDDD